MKISKSVGEQRKGGVNSRQAVRAEKGEERPRATYRIDTNTQEHHIYKNSLAGVQESIALGGIETVVDGSMRRYAPVGYRPVWWVRSVR